MNDHNYDFRIKDDYLTCNGQMFLITAERTDEGNWIAQLWGEIPATRWEPADMDVVKEQEFPLLSDAIGWATQTDGDYWDREQCYLKEMEYNFNYWEPAEVDG